MKERPILFSAPMVRAILEGRKTQTRRVVKPQPVVSEYDPDMLHFNEAAPRARRIAPRGKVMPKGTLHSWTTTRDEFASRCPHGQPGDTLWVRETWAAQHTHDHLPPRLVPQWARIHYAATAGLKGHLDLGGLLPRPSIFMPRWASRITLEIVSVRVERLQEISDEDARSEGVDFGNITDALTGEIDRDACEAFATLWESINGPGSWDANPLVWVVEFKRVEQSA